MFFFSSYYLINTFYYLLLAKIHFFSNYMPPDPNFLSTLSILSYLFDYWSWHKRIMRYICNK